MYGPASLLLFFLRATIDKLVLILISVAGTKSITLSTGENFEKKSHPVS